LCEGVNGISENVWSDKVVFYPNPGRNQLTIEASGYCRIWDVQGREIYRQRIQGKQVINTAGWVSGMYVIQCGEHHQRWIKE
jgi:hypothetical protein